MTKNYLAKKFGWFAGAIAVLVVVVVLSAHAQTATQSTQTQTTQTQPKPVDSTGDLPDAPGASMPVMQRIEPTGPTAVIDTTMGRMTCKLFDKQAPNTVANFIGLAEGTKVWTDPTTHRKVQGKPFYNGLTFHRVIPEFMIQGGDPIGDGTGDAGYFFNDETDPNLNFDVAGRLAMANAGPNTNGSQFFITEAPQPSLDQHYNLFGQCDDASVETVKAIARVSRNPLNDKPYTPVVIKKVTIVRDGQPMPPGPAMQSAQPTTDGPQSGARKSLTPQH